MTITWLFNGDSSWLWCKEDLLSCNQNQHRNQNIFLRGIGLIMLSLIHTLDDCWKVQKSWSWWWSNVDSWRWFYNICHAWLRWNLLCNETCKTNENADLDLIREQNSVIEFAYFLRRLELDVELQLLHMEKGITTKI